MGRVKSTRWGRVEVVGTTGFEPATSWSQTRRSTKLSYVPNDPKTFLATQKPCNWFFRRVSASGREGSFRMAWWRLRDGADMATAIKVARRGPS